MDTKLKKCCPNCSQFYHLKSSTQPKANIPLFLQCGHSMCENCIRNIVKFQEPIECKICHRDMEISASDALLAHNKSQLYQLCPVNLSLLGELTLHTLEAAPENQKKKEDDFYIDLQAIIKSADTSQGQCIECHNVTSKMCRECASVLCDACFNKSHKNFIVFLNHVLQNIKEVTEPNNCKIHKGKPLDYYCKDCSKAICMDCLMVGGEKSCKNHNIVSMQEVNDGFLEEIGNVAPKVDETYRRLTKTAVDVGHLLHNIENETGPSSELTNMLAMIEQHFSKLAAAIQKHKSEVTDIIVKLKCSEKESLLKAKDDLTNMIRKSRRILNSINSTIDSDKAKQVNLAVLLDEAKSVVECPWYLTKDECDDALKMTVNDDLCTLINDFIHLEGNANSVYKLRASSELKEGVEIPPPPPAPVFPPELPKDVRQSNKFKAEMNPAKTQGPAFYKNVPKYRAKSGSVSSLNSCDSEGSQKSSITIYGDGFQRPVIQQVQPFPESQHPKQLVEGAQELIYISHIVDPHNFFVQRSCHQGFVKEMLRECRNAVSLPKPSVNHVTEGKIYLMLNKTDNMWQRCRIVSINRKDVNNPTYLVFCIDFGSTETVSIDKLRLLSPARLQSPPLAINCSLANCEPKSGSWTSDDSYLIQNIIDNKQAILHVRHIRATSNYGVSLVCDVTTFDQGISLAHALVFHDRARMPKPKLPYPKIVGIMDKPKLYMGNHDLKVKSVEEVYLTTIVSPDKFFVRKRHLQAVYEKLCEDLEQEYSLSVNSGTVYLPEIGMVCVVNLEKYRAQAGEGSAWARAVIHELPGRGRVRVLLPDSGRLLLVHWTALRHMHQKHTTLRALAIECHLAGVTPLNKKWSLASVALLQRFEDRLLEMQIDDTNKGSVGITLYDKADPDDVVCVNWEMIKHKFAVTFGMFPFNKNAAVENQVYTNKSPLDVPKPVKRDPNQIKILNRNEKTKKINEDDLEAKDKGPLRVEAKLLHYQSPSQVYISLVHQQKTFNEMFEKIQKHYMKQKVQGKDQWAEGDRCCTVCLQSKTYRRAAVVELQGDNAKVFYSDFACIETVPVSSLKELAPEFTTVGDAAIKCHLSGVIPAVGEDWPTITTEYLKELLDAYQRVFITKVGDFKNKSMPIEMWVYHTVQGGALEPNKSEWRCLNKQIVQQGLGIPDKTHKENEDTAEKNDDDILKFLNVTGSVREWLQLEPLPLKPLDTKLDNDSPTPNTADGEDDMKLEDPLNNSNTVFISDWLPPEPLQSKEFTAMPTYIDNNGVIYLHDVSQQDTLDLIRKALDVRFKAPDQKAKYTKWTVGEPCIAMYYLDNRFYRGRILSVNKENCTCIVHYIDYGNEETCSFENLRKCIVLYQIPTQAHKCVLARVRPVDDQWDRQTLDYMHKSIVEKLCFVKIVGETRADVSPIDLKFDKLWINDHLVDFEMAVYTDGSKAVIRKFAPHKSVQERNVEPVELEMDSGPDYIVEDTASSSMVSLEMKSIDGKDWNELIQEEEYNAIDGQYVTYPKNTETEFLCNITIINGAEVLELSIIHNDETNILYEEMFEALQSEGADMLALNGIYENKACAAVFHEDGKWYRATILQYSESNHRVKVRYVDYGNIEVISLADVREIGEKWTTLPPATVQAKLYGVMLNPDLDIHAISKEYADTFLDKGPFHAKVIKSDSSLPHVELRNDQGELVYQNLFAKQVFLNCDDVD